MEQRNTSVELQAESEQQRRVIIFTGLYETVNIKQQYK